MPPAPHAPFGPPDQGDDPYKRMLATKSTFGEYDPRRALGAAYGTPRRELPPITDADFIQHGREQFNRGYITGVWDAVKITVALTALLAIVAYAVLTR